MPIVTQGSNGIFISPFIVRRDRPHQPFIAPALKICAASEFPEAEYNPAFLKRIKQITNSPAISEKKPMLMPYWAPERRRRYWRNTHKRREFLGL